MNSWGRTLVSVSAALAGFALANGCVAESETEEKPKAPDISATVEAYNNPTAPLNEDTIDGLLDFAQDTYGLIEDLEVDEQVLDAINEALEQDEESNGAGGEAPADAPTGAQVDDGPVRQKNQQVTLLGDGFVRVTRVCEGWEEPVVDEDKNGSLLSLIGFTDSELDPVIWGDFRDCKYRTPAGEVHLDNGDGALDAGVALHIGESQTAEEFGTEPILFVLNLDATVEGDLQEARFSFRIDQQTGRMELLFETADGSLVLLMDDGALVGVRAVDGEYSCDATEGTCIAADDTVLEL